VGDQRRRQWKASASCQAVAEHGFASILATYLLPQQGAIRMACCEDLARASPTSCQHEFSKQFNGDVPDCDPQDLCRCTAGVSTTSPSGAALTRSHLQWMADRVRRAKRVDLTA